MGNLNGRPMDNITGARGPVLVLRSLFAELSRLGPTRPLPRNPLLQKVRICLEDGRRAGAECPSRDELFVVGTEPGPRALIPDDKSPLRLRQPHNGLLLAMDPRIPDESEAFPFLLNNPPPAGTVVWYVDGQPVAKGHDAEEYVWPMRKGEHTARAEVTIASGEMLRTEQVRFVVK